jgi:hypothetical protein
MTELPLVLVIDDDPMQRLLIAAALKAEYRLIGPMAAKQDWRSPANNAPTLC